MPASVPDLCLTQMDLDASKLPQIHLDPCMNNAHTFGSTNDVNVVKVCKQAFITAEEMLDGTQGLVLPKREEHGHERVALFAAFTLVDDVDRTIIILPQIL